MKIDWNYRERMLMIDGKEISPVRSQKVFNHSPDGFNSGYSGSGPAQLALGILLEAMPQAKAQRLYQRFKWDYVANWKEDFHGEIDIEAWVARQEESLSHEHI